MLRNLYPCLLALLLLALAAPAQAKGVPNFTAVNAALKAAEKSGKATMIVAGATVPKASTNPRDSFAKLFKDHQGVRERAEKFELAFVEAYSPSDCNNGNYCISPAVKKKYGTPLSISLWTPTGATYMWQHTISEQTFTNNDPTPSGEKLAALMDQALEHWNKWQAKKTKLLEDAKAKKLSDKKLKTVEMQIRLAGYYADGSMVDESVAAWQYAAKLAKKGAKKEPSLEEVEKECAFEACQTYLKAERFDKAYAAFVAYAKSYKDSEKGIEAHFLAAKCLLGSKKLKPALKAFKAILRNKKLAAIHAKSEEAADQIEAELKGK